MPSRSLIGLPKRFSPTSKPSFHRYRSFACQSSALPGKNPILVGWRNAMGRVNYSLPPGAVIYARWKVIRMIFSTSFPWISRWICWLLLRGKPIWTNAKNTWASTIAPPVVSIHFIGKKWATTSPSIQNGRRTNMHFAGRIYLSPAIVFCMIPMSSSPTWFQRILRTWVYVWSAVRRVWSISTRTCIAPCSVSNRSPFVARFNVPTIDWILFDSWSMKATTPQTSTSTFARCIGPPTSNRI